MLTQDMALAMLNVSPGAAQQAVNEAFTVRYQELLAQHAAGSVSDEDKTRRLSLLLEAQMILSGTKAPAPQDERWVNAQQVLGVSATSTLTDTGAAFTARLLKAGEELQSGRISLDDYNATYEALAAAFKILSGTREVTGTLEPPQAPSTPRVPGPPSSGGPGMPPIVVTLPVSCPVCSARGEVPQGTELTHCSACASDLAFQRCLSCRDARLIAASWKRWTCACGKENKYGRTERAVQGFARGFQQPVRITGAWISM